jgi:chromosome segregation ATPase
VPRLDALRAKKQTFLKFQNLKSEREDIANYLILFDYFNTLVSYINLTPVKSREI